MEGVKAGRLRMQGVKARRFALVSLATVTAIIAVAVSVRASVGHGLQAVPAQPTPLQRLEESIQRTTRSVNATWGIYVKSLESGEEIALDADRQMETMSTIKIPLMVEVFEQIKAGKFKLTDKYTFV